MGKFWSFFSFYASGSSMAHHNFLSDWNRSLLLKLPSDSPVLRSTLATSTIFPPLSINPALIQPGFQSYNHPPSLPVMDTTSPRTVNIETEPLAAVPQPPSHADKNTIVQTGSSPVKTQPSETHPSTRLEEDATPKTLASKTPKRLPKNKPAPTRKQPPRSKSVAKPDQPDLPEFSGKDKYILSVPERAHLADGTWRLALKIRSALKLVGHAFGRRANGRLPFGGLTSRTDPKSPNEINLVVTMGAFAGTLRDRRVELTLHFARKGPKSSAKKLTNVVLILDFSPSKQSDKIEFAVVV
jgi:hypothetical protein